MSFFPNIFFQYELSFSNLKIFLVLMISKLKALEIGEIHFETHLITFASSMFLTLKL
jgi:hypothetical protein